MRSDGILNANDTLRDLRVSVPSLSIDPRKWDALNDRLAARFRFASSGIDWSQTNALVETTLKSTPAVQDFVRAAVRNFNLQSADRLLLIGDHLFEEVVTLRVEHLEYCVAELAQLPLGFILGPLDGSWDWVIDVRFAGAAWAGKAPEVTR